MSSFASTTEQYDSVIRSHSDISSMPVGDHQNASALVHKLSSLRRALLSERKQREACEGQNVEILAKLGSLETENSKLKEKNEELRHNNLMLKHLVDMLKEEKSLEPAVIVEFQDQNEVGRIMALPRNALEKEVSQILCNYNLLRKQHTELNQRATTLSSLQSNKGATTGSSEETEKYKALSKELIEEIGDLRKELELRDKRRRRDVKRLGELLEGKTEAARKASEQLVKVKELSSVLAKRAFEYKKKLEAAEIGVRRFEVHQVVERKGHGLIEEDEQLVPAQITIKETPSTGEVLFCLVTDRLQYEYVQDVSTITVRSLTVDGRQLQLAKGITPTSPVKLREKYPSAEGDSSKAMNQQFQGIKQAQSHVIRYRFIVSFRTDDSKMMVFQCDEDMRDQCFSCLREFINIRKDGGGGSDYTPTKAAKEQTQAVMSAYEKFLKKKFSSPKKR